MTKLRYCTFTTNLKCVILGYNIVFDDSQKVRDNWLLDEISECTKNARQPLKVNLIWRSLDLWMHTSNSSKFHSLLNNMLFCNEVINHKNHCEYTVWSKSQPQNVLVQWQFVFKHFDSMRPRRHLTMDQTYLNTTRLQRTVELRESQGVISRLKQRHRLKSEDWSHRNTLKWTSFVHIPWQWCFIVNRALQTVSAEVYSPLLLRFDSKPLFAMNKWLLHASS